MALYAAGGLGIASLYFATRSSTLQATNTRKQAPCASTAPDVDAMVADVANHADAWVKLPHAEKLAILKEMFAILKDIKDEVGLKGAELRNAVGTQTEGFGVVMSLICSANYLKGLIETYESLVQRNKPADVIARRSVGDTEVVQIHPRPGIWAKITDGIEIELWGEHGKKTPQTNPSGGGGVCAVLCPGNFEGPDDVLHQLFMEQNVVIFKNHPINAHCTDVLNSKLLLPLVERGFVGMCSGDNEISSHLLHHAKVDTWMMTGGAGTFDAITWGGAKGKAAGKKVLNKPCHAELGGVTPYMIAPGKLTDAELKYQAQYLVALKFFNSGHICASPQVVMLDSSWPQAARFVEHVKETVSGYPTVASYYPGSAERQAAVENKYASSLRFAANLVLVPDLDAPGGEADYLIKNEVFCNALGVKLLEGNNDPATFFDKAVAFSNEECVGSLSCNVVIDPKTRASFDFDGRVLDKLDWGTIAVNNWSGAVASNPYGIWGAHKDAHTAADIQSGMGQLGNCLFVSNVRKQVTYGKWCDPGILTIMTPSWKTYAIGWAFANVAIKGRVQDLLGLVKALVLGK